MCPIDPQSKLLLKTQDCAGECERQSGREGNQLWLLAIGQYQAAVVGDAAAEGEMAVSESAVHRECNTSCLHSFP